MLQESRCTSVPNNFIRSIYLSQKTKFYTYETIVLPTVLYCCKKYVIHKKSEKNFHQWECKIIRRILGEKKTEEHQRRI